ncbi:MAG TPA: tetratricopeptide repeat protein [Gemmatimonadaceae bacterium]|nr:tetratricopeptide repeat protein [Gemmatimonadaceae bacterium]
MIVTMTDEATAITLCAEGAVLSDAGDMPAAIARYRDAVAKAPGLLPLHLILGNAQLLAGDVPGARDTLRRAQRVAERPDAATEFTLGKALVDAGAGADAVPCFRRVRAELPHDVAAASALAAALRDAQRPDEAWKEISHALTLAPDDAVALHTAALIRHDLGDFSRALELVERSLEVRPDSSGTRVTRGYLHHLLGDHEGGWHDFESRPLPDPQGTSRAWNGEPLDGRSITLLGEQGTGDQFQFLRFARHPALRSASRVVITCHRDAVSLLQAAGYEAVAREERVDTDFHAPLLSLPLLLGLDAAWTDETSCSPYLVLPDAVPARSLKPRRVGVTWAGNPAHRNDAVRSIPSALLHGLLHTHPDLRFVCMQHGVSGHEMPIGRFEPCGGGDWLATARHLLTLDLLITVDTGIAHLAGALGVPVWIMLPHVPDWRWGAAGNRTPWYPSARLFRQPARGEWARVLTSVSAALSSAEIGAA